MKQFIILGKKVLWEAVILKISLFCGGDLVFIDVKKSKDRLILALAAVFAAFSLATFPHFAPPIPSQTTARTAPLLNLPVKKESWLTLTKIVKQTNEMLLDILGINVPERM